MIIVVTKHSNMKNRLWVYLSDIDKYRKPIPNPCNKVCELLMNNEQSRRGNSFYDTLSPPSVPLWSCWVVCSILK